MDSASEDALPEGGAQAVPPLEPTNADADLFDAWSSTTAGAYRQNTFYIRMRSEADLEPSEGSPLPLAVSVHAHEYVHFLHNASTTAGHTYLLTNLGIIHMLVQGCDARGNFLGVERLTEGQRADLDFAVKLMRAQLGTTRLRDLPRATNLRQWKCGPSDVKEADGKAAVSTSFSVKNAAGETQEENVLIGLSFITEGVAYEVDRELRRLHGVPEHQLDEGVSVFPYLAYRVLLEAWSGRDFSSRERIEVGVAAMSHQLAGLALAKICSQLQLAAGEPVEAILARFKVGTKTHGDAMLKALQEYRIDASSGNATAVGLAEYVKLAEAGVRLRQGNLVPELALAGAPWSPEELRKCIGLMLDCLVIQGKPEGRSEMYWIGPGEVAATDEQATFLGALQAALHFSQLHLTERGPPRPTARIPSGQFACPFTGGCVTEERDDFPEECRSAPWKRFGSSPQEAKLCWYAAGVRSLNGPQ